MHDIVATKTLLFALCSLQLQNKKFVYQAEVYAIIPILWNIISLTATDEETVNLQRGSIECLAIMLSLSVTDQKTELFSEPWVSVFQIVSFIKRNILYSSSLPIAFQICTINIVISSIRHMDSTSLKHLNILLFSTLVDTFCKSAHNPVKSASLQALFLIAYHLNSASSSFLIPYLDDLMHYCCVPSLADSDASIRFHGLKLVGIVLTPEHDFEPILVQTLITSLNSLSHIDSSPDVRVLAEKYLQLMNPPNK